jgi:hypothetical protein
MTEHSRFFPREALLVKKGLLILAVLFFLPAQARDLDRPICGGLTAGLRYSLPIDFSVPVGMVIIRCEEEDKDGEDQGLFGALIELEPGISGGKVSAGFFVAHRPDSDVGLLPLARRSFSLAVKATYVETWGNPWLSQVKEDQTYIGFEHTLAIGDFVHPRDHRHRDRPGAFEFTLGYLYRIRDRGHSANNQLVVGVGYVF